MARASRIDVEYRQGLHVRGSVLWLDAPRRGGLCFVSHAHVAAAGPQHKILSSAGTAVLLGRGRGGSRTLVSPFYRRFALGDLDLELHPAGHLPGSAQICAERGGRRLVYTGDFQLEPTRTAGRGVLLQCDVLVLRAVYGRSHHVFPPREETEARLVEWAERSLEAGTVPVIFAAALGKAQEVAAILGGSGMEVRVHRSIYRICRLYRSLGMPLPNVSCLRSPAKPGGVIVLPPGLRRSRLLSGLVKARTCAVSGRVLDRPPPTHERLVLSGHADRPALIRYARESGARRIYPMGPEAATLAADLARMGLSARPLITPEQMDLFVPANAGSSS